MRRVALIAAVFGVATILATGSRTAHAAPLSSTANRTVIVQPGDSLTKLSEEYGTTAARLFEANTQIINPDLIFPGERLRVPGPTEKLTARPLSTAPIVAAVASVPHPQIFAAPAGNASSPGVWVNLAVCESGGNWNINTGNGFYGGLQFTLSSWQAVGGSGYPNYASEAEQISRAEKLQAMQGWSAWPACSARLGL